MTRTDALNRINHAGNGIYELNGYVVNVQKTKTGTDVWMGEKTSQCRVRKVNVIKSFKTAMAAVPYAKNHLAKFAELD